MENLKLLSELLEKAEWVHEDTLAGKEHLRVVWDCESLSRANITALSGFGKSFEDDGMFHLSMNSFKWNKLGLLDKLENELELI